MSRPPPKALKQDIGLPHSTCSGRNWERKEERRPTRREGGEELLTGEGAGAEGAGGKGKAMEAEGGGGCLDSTVAFFEKVFEN